MFKQWQEAPIGRCQPGGLPFTALTYRFNVLASLPLALWSAPVDDRDVDVHVTRSGDDFSVSVDCPVAAPVAAVWEVLTDYDHMTQFTSNLGVSNVRNRNGNQLMVLPEGERETWATDRSSSKMSERCSWCHTGVSFAPGEREP